MAALRGPREWGALALSAIAASCALTRDDVPLLARASVAADYETYEVHRVGLMPVAGGEVDPAMTRALEEGLLAEVSRTTPFEVVRLGAGDLEEVRRSEPYRRGKYELGTIIDVARRYRLDAVFFATVLQQQFYPPITLGVQVDMVACETGLVIWSGAVHLDATDAAVRRGLEIYYGRLDDSDEAEQSWEVALVSPSRYARFAAYQIARLL